MEGPKGGTGGSLFPSSPRTAYLGILPKAWVMTALRPERRSENVDIARIAASCSLFLARSYAAIVLGMNCIRGIAASMLGSVMMSERREEIILK